MLILAINQKSPKDITEGILLGNDTLHKVIFIKINYRAEQASFH